MCVVDLRLERVANVLITGFNIVILDKKKPKLSERSTPTSRNMILFVGWSIKPVIQGSFNGTFPELEGQSR